MHKIAYNSYNGFVPRHRTHGLNKVSKTITCIPVTNKPIILDNMYMYQKKMNTTKPASADNRFIISTIPINM